MRLRRMQILEVHFLVASQVPGQLKVRGRGIEVSPVKINREPGPALLEIIAAIRTQLRGAQSPSAPQRAKVGRLGPGESRVNRAPRILYVWQRPHLATALDLFSAIPFPDRIALETRTPEAIFVTQLHLSKGYRLRGSGGLPVAIAPNLQALRRTPHAERDSAA